MQFTLTALLINSVFLLNVFYYKSVFEESLDRTDEKIRQ